HQPKPPTSQTCNSPAIVQRREQDNRLAQQERPARLRRPSVTTGSPRSGRRWCVSSLRRRTRLSTPPGQEAVIELDPSGDSAKAAAEADSGAAGRAQK